MSYYLVRGFVAMFRFLPFWALYGLSDFMAWCFYQFGYRKKVVFGNLKKCFPEKSDAELAKIAKESYRNLTDISLESIKATTLPMSEIRRRYTYKNYDPINKLLDAGKSVVLTGGHYNNWEWGVLTIASGFRGKTIGVYKPLSNKRINDWFFKSRERDPNMILKSMKETYGSIEEFKGQPSVFILVGDQSPSNRKSAQWIDFFGQKTACLPGVDNIARDHAYPVFLYHIVRKKRGFYHLEFIEVCLEPEKMSEGAVTQTFMHILEGKIRENASPWLWSHKRWKMKF